MVDAVTECTTPADVATDLLPQCRAGQEVALVATLLGHATNHNTATSSDNNEAETLDLNLVCLGAVAAAADMYGVTHQQVLRGTRRGTDVLARRLAMTVTHLLVGGRPETGHPSPRNGHSNSSKWCPTGSNLVHEGPKNGVL